MTDKITFTGEPRNPNARDPDICVVTCAVNGLLATRKQCAGIPYTPVEIAEEARRAYEAGAAVVHIHGRNDDGSPTASPAVFARIKEEVRKRCPIILNFSTGTILEEVDEQCTYIRESRPEIGSLNMGTMNYSKYSRARKSFDFDLVFPNTYQKIGKLLSAMNEAGVKPELECFDAGHTQGVWPLIDMGLLKPPLDFSFIVNVLGGAPAHVESLQLQIRTMPAGSEWGVICISHGQWRMLAAALVLGGNLRCGLEDHLYLPDGAMARNNGEIVDSAVRLIRNIGRRPATVEEARTIFGLGPANPAAS